MAYSDYLPGVNVFTCPHTIEHPTNDSSLIDLGQNNLLVLCRNCRDLLIGIFVKDIVRQMNDDAIKSNPQALQQLQRRLGEIE